MDLSTQEFERKNLEKTNMPNHRITANNMPQLALICFNKTKNQVKTISSSHMSKDKTKENLLTIAKVGMTQKNFPTTYVIVTFKGRC